MIPAPMTHLEEAVERVAALRPCRTCEGTGVHPPDNPEGNACWDCHDGTVDGRQVIRDILQASGLTAAGRSVP